MTTEHVYSLPKSCRLRKADEFRAVLRHRTVFESLSLRLHIKLKPINDGYARIGLIVAKKIERKAVRRNRIKRLIREAFRKHRQVIQGTDCVMQLRRSVEPSDSARIYQEAVTLLHKAARQL
ncbi:MULTISPECIES: ribonuclease P protein component [Nitrosomonas]|uniref:ribonuclease P protein component n=1 Tax=Nitrosomonas TaxID=914 RepID=UPI000897C951|nr:MULTISPECIES: ribonuclease P protein component [Nitrosomonas]MXS80509.1 ribonuclease P protein component [Nitrosomonas sp. GH22]SDW54759.1 ribonuclease P protein component [Nitrosomonas eutropha]SEI55035.1 ribonuclease P protein component [Nitrosomonas eutropha]